MRGDKRQGVSRDSVRLTFHAGGARGGNPGGHLRSVSSVFEMMTLQGNPRWSAAKGMERGHLEGLPGSVRRVCAAPTHLEW